MKISSPLYRQPPAFLLGALLACAVFAAYFPALTGGFVWDDAAHVTKPELRSLTGLARIWFEVGATQQYYPVLHSAFWLEHRLWGDAALGYHLVNLAFHVTAACLFAALLRRLAVPGAWLAAFLFAVHPVQVESVAWISEQKNTLSLVFYLGAALVYLHFDDSRSLRAYALALVLFCFALLTKTVTATLPAALLVIFWWRRGRLEWRRDVQPLLPWLAIGVAAGLFTAWVERTIIGAQGAGFDLSLLQRSLLAGRVICFYLGKLLWPSDLTFIYPRWIVDASVPWQWIFPAAVIALLAGLWRCRQRTRSPLAALLLFAGSLFPVLGFFNIYPFIFSFVADHFQYLASLAVITLVAVGFARFRGFTRVLPAGVVGLLALLTWRQSRSYRDARTLYLTTIERNPTCWMAYNNLGEFLVGEGRLEEAIGHYRKTLELYAGSAIVHFNLAVALEKTDHLTEAIEQFQTALRLRPDYGGAHMGLGLALQRAGRFAEAIEHEEQAIQLEPNFPQAYNNLGVVLLDVGRNEEAVARFKHALRLRPDYPDARDNLSSALVSAGRSEEAVAELNALILAHPEFANAHNNLGNILRKTGRIAEAIPHYEQALRLAPRQAEYRLSLGTAFRFSNRFEEAIRQFEEALKIRPAYPEAHYSLAIVLPEVGRLAEAKAHYAEARRLRPDLPEMTW